MTNKGFTLIETLGAILLLSIAIAGPLTIAAKGLHTALIAKDQSTAYYLAQDAVEFVRYARDTNCLVAGATGSIQCPAANWLAGNGSTPTINLTPCVSTNGSTACYLDQFPSSPSGAVTTCGAATCPTAINYDSGNNYFTYQSPGGNINSTIFIRTVQITNDPACGAPCNQNEADITVTVSWLDPIQHSVTVKENLYRWQ
jgi:Tfp pilus assembly protein PilV